MEWIKATTVIDWLVKKEDKLLTFKSNNMNFTGWYYPKENHFLDVLNGVFPVDDILVLDESESSNFPASEIRKIKNVTPESLALFLESVASHTWSNGEYSYTKDALVNAAREVIEICRIHCSVNSKPPATLSASIVDKLIDANPYETGEDAEGERYSGWENCINKLRELIAAQPASTPTGNEKILLSAIRDIASGKVLPQLIAQQALEQYSLPVEDQDDLWMEVHDIVREDNESNHAYVSLPVEKIKSQFHITRINKQP